MKIVLCFILDAVSTWRSVLSPCKSSSRARLFRWWRRCAAKEPREWLARTTSLLRNCSGPSADWRPKVSQKASRPWGRKKNKTKKHVVGVHQSHWRQWRQTSTVDCGKEGVHFYPPSPKCFHVKKSDTGVKNRQNTGDHTPPTPASHQNTTVFNICKSLQKCMVFNKIKIKKKKVW